MRPSMLISVGDEITHVTMDQNDTPIAKSISSSEFDLHHSQGGLVAWIQ